jgi:sugar-specific transcriptional regulator TrmB
MNQEILQQLGFSQNEAKIYKALLVLKKASVSHIASYTDLYRRNAYDGIKRMVEKDVVYPILESTEKLYAPVPPDKLMDIVRLQELELAEILPSLRKKFYQRTESQEAYISRA